MVKILSIFMFFKLCLIFGVETQQNRVIAWIKPELYPKLQSHKGYDQNATDGGGERVLVELAIRVCLDERTVGCYKRCILEYLGILQETSILEEGEELYGKMLFEPENWIDENLKFLLFTKEENDSAKNIARRLVTGCTAIVNKLNAMSGPPTCHEQNELHLCMEQAMNCPKVELEKGTLVTKVCTLQEYQFHYYSDKIEPESRMYNESYPDVSCHKTHDPETSQALSVLSKFCARSLRGCFKRCMFEQLGVIEYIMQPKYHLYRIGFRKEESIEESLQFYLFPSATPDLGANVANQIITQCENLVQIFKDMMAPPSCKEENELYMCIEKAIGCSGKPLQKGTLITKTCSLEQVEYYYNPEDMEAFHIAPATLISKEVMTAREFDSVDTIKNDLFKKTTDLEKAFGEFFLRCIVIESPIRLTRYGCPLCTPEKDAEMKTVDCEPEKDCCHSIEKRLNCDEFTTEATDTFEEKWCFLATDLCNGNFSYLSNTTAKNYGTIGTGTGFTSRQLSVDFNIVSALFIWNLYF